MLTVTLPDGSERRLPEGSSPEDVAAGISPSLAKRALAARVDGELRDLRRPLDGDARVEIVTPKDDDALELIRHDAAHVLAQAVKELFPDTQVTIGPTVEDGFYYDFFRETPFSSDDFEAIEAKMREIVDADLPIEREEWTREAAIAFFEREGEQFKAELIRDLPESETITVYRQGAWLDLCRGPHLPSTGRLPKAFKLRKLAGAYWRGDANNAQLQRMYGTAWMTPKELRAYETRLEEAERRDHRKLARELGLFHLDPKAQGSVFWHPAGYRLWREVEEYVRRRMDKAGYQEIKTPQLMDAEAWRKSGHWGKYRENMFIVPDFIPKPDEDDAAAIEVPEDAALMALKPMNCPAHVEVFAQGQKSYRDLPLRLAEFGCCHRNEPHGALHGIFRLRQFTQDDAHIFCRDDQVVGETVAFCELLRAMYADFGFDKVDVKLSTRPETRAGDDATWDAAEAALEEAVQAAGLPYAVMPGEGAFYGPKLEFQLTDAIGRVWQCGTLQLDYVMPERLGADYIAEDGSKQRPVMLHRAVLGSVERFLGILIEEYAGAFPMWLAPVQVVVATITDASIPYAQEAAERLRASGLRVELDTRNEKINYKVREHSHAKRPVIAAVGGREAENRTLALRRFGSKRQEVVALDEAADTLAAEAVPPDLREG